MGFGFNLAFMFFIVPCSILLFIIGCITGKASIFNFLGTVWGAMIFIGILVSIVGSFEPHFLDKKDYYGNYTIDRDFFSGEQADWQYNHYRFSIEKNDSIYFYVTNKNKILKTYTGSIYTVKPYSSEILGIQMNPPTHHVLASNPTIYREGWEQFFMVFTSLKYHNMYFRKGDWKPID